MSKSIEALNRIETVVPFNRENKPNYYSQFMQSETPFYEDFDLVKKDLEVLEILKKKMVIDTDYYDSDVGCEEFEYIAYNGQPLNIENKEEYDLIKEWLENDK